MAVIEGKEHDPPITITLLSHARIQSWEKLMARVVHIDLWEDRRQDGDATIQYLAEELDY